MAESKRREDMTSREYLDYLWEQSQRPEVREKLRSLEPIATFRKATWPDDGPDA